VAVSSEHRWIVPLPPEVRTPFTVFVNGVLQQEGTDYTTDGRELRFGRELRKEPPVSFWRWFVGAFGIGTYRRNDQVDVAWHVDGSPRVAHALDITPPEGT
jgi:hypothetical protein